MTKIISFSQGLPGAFGFERKKQRPLTALMVNSLVTAYSKQKEGIPFGQNDLKGSFTALIARGLIIKKRTTDDQDKCIWQVTTEAIEILKAMEIRIQC